MLRTIFAGLKGSFNFEQSLIERAACTDAIDREILHLLFEAGSPGLLPKDLAGRLEEFKIIRHQVSRRILRMNKRIEKEFGEHIVERRGWHWLSLVLRWKLGVRPKKMRVDLGRLKLELVDNSCVRQTKYIGKLG